MEYQATSARKKRYPLTKNLTTAIIFWCSQPSLQFAVRTFIKDEVGLIDGEYVPIPIPGGILSLAAPRISPWNFQYATETAKFFLAEGQDPNRLIRRAIFINHRACKAYLEAKKKKGASFLAGCSSISERQKSDFRIAKEVVAGLADRPWKFENHFLNFPAGDDACVLAERA